MAQHSEAHKAAHDHLQQAMAEYHDELRKIRDAEMELRVKRAVLMTVANKELSEKLSTLKVSSDLVGRALAFCW